MPVLNFLPYTQYKVRRWMQRTPIRTSCPECNTTWSESWPSWIIFETFNQGIIDWDDAGVAVSEQLCLQCETDLRADYFVYG